MVKDLKALKFSSDGDLYKVCDETARSAINNIRSASGAKIVDELPSLQDGEIGIVYLVDNDGSYLAYTKAVKETTTYRDDVVTEYPVVEEVNEVFNGDVIGDFYYDGKEYIKISEDYYNVTGSVAFDSANERYLYTGSICTVINNRAYSWQPLGGDIQNLQNQINELQSAKLVREIVDELPTDNIKTNTIYMVRRG